MMNEMPERPTEERGIVRAKEIVRFFVELLVAPGCWYFAAGLSCWPAACSASLQTTRTFLTKKPAAPPVEGTAGKGKDGGR